MTCFDGIHVFRDGIEGNGQIVPVVSLAEEYFIHLFAVGELLHSASQADEWSDEAVTQLDYVIDEKWEHEGHADEDRPVLVPEGIELFEEEQVRIAEREPDAERDRQEQEAAGPIGDHTTYDRALNLLIDIQFFAFWNAHFFSPVKITKQ